jgi:Xaa-Pro aminopeptidase
MSEIDLAAIYERYVVSHGAAPFFTVITCNERAAYADTPVTSHKIVTGDLVRFDVGCIYQGYRADIARTAVAGIPSEKVRRYYQAILLGLKAALAIVKPGVSCAAIFETAVNSVRGAGMPWYKRHHCGHSIGLEVSEPPGLAPSVTDPLEEGMVLCLETPYYEIGWGGVQVEDTLLVTKDGYQLFTQSPEEPLQLGGQR